MSDEEGEEMNKSVEQFFVKTYIDKDYQERLLFELNSIKKRSKALSRFSHDVESFFKKKCKQKNYYQLGRFSRKRPNSLCHFLGRKRRNNHVYF